MSESVLAAGCTMSRYFMIVAPVPPVSIGWVGGWVGGLVGSLVGWPETHDMAAAAAAATAHGPSLEMVTPLPLYMSLSMPRGPRVERTESATAWGVCRINNAWVS